MELGLRDRVALVTGASGGIGSAVACALGEEGARVAVAYHSDRARAEQVAGEVVALGGEAMVLPYDLGDLAAVQAAVGAVGERWGGVDVLVASAVQPEATPPGAVPFEAQPAQDWQRSLRSGLEGTLATVQAVLPSMKAKGWGRIVLVAANVFAEGVPGREAYATAKAGVHGLARTLALTLGPRGILVNVAVLSLTLTERNRRQVPPQVLERFRAATPTGRLSEPGDAARAIAFLASAANGNITGAFLPVTGGR